ncbi:MAG TPA: cation diffusion facilitator family transporter [Bacteroidales bacterium]|nr:cation diffusion facilitator family transporter [Bacteroidales bacterium]
MGRGHDHGNDKSGRSLLLASLLNIFITIVEIIGGILSNSLALLSDALHNLSDTLAVLLAYFARRISRRESNERKTFGYKRIEILAAFFNAMVLIGVSAFLIYEGVKRFYEPEPIKGLLMFIVAAAGLAFNLIAVLLLKDHAGHSLNVRSAYLHLLGDTFSSVAVIIGGILIYFWEIYWIDPVITILISLYILKETFPILKQSADILMQGTPDDINIASVITSLENINGISNIHHVHIWSLSDNEYHFECHAELESDMVISETKDILATMEKILREEYAIGHLTVQFEFRLCHDNNAIHKS